mmetsp:Transcript_24250/g.48396  ORF Transcript_24250/g.48396 Transcript_24250/m.48396 type:complete len:87 (-) Transcript_24250:393-653(-)
MIVSSEIWPGLMELLEPPSRQLPRKTFILRLGKVGWDNFIQECMLVMKLPSATMRHPTNYVSILRIGQYPVKISRKARRLSLARDK